MSPLLAMYSCRRLFASCQYTVSFWTLFNFFSILFMHLTPLVNALVPNSVYGMAYTTINEDKLIIQGGIDYQTPLLSNNVSQFMILDLTLKTWETANAPWSNVDSSVALPPAFTTSFHSMSAAPDRQIVTIWDSASPGSVTNFNLTGKTWTSLTVPTQLQSSMKGLKAVSHPTGMVYIPLGDRGVNMLLWDPNGLSTGAGAAAVGADPPTSSPDATAPSGTGAVSFETMPVAVEQGGTGYTWTWSNYRKTFILFGGRPGTDPTAPYLHEYDPKTREWTVMNTTGVVVPRLEGSCMEPAYKGTKMILFGGRGVESVATGSIYILDLPSMKWTQGPPVDTLQNRSHMACGVSGDNFLVFGGIRRTDPNTIFKLEPTILIYNLYSKLWVTKFERGSHYIAPPSTSPTPTKPVQPIDTTPTSPSSSGLSGGVIAGIVAGVLALLAVIAVFIFYITRRHRSQVRHNEDGERDDKAELADDPRPSTGSHYQHGGGAALEELVPKSHPGPSSIRTFIPTSDGPATPGPANSRTDAEPPSPKPEKSNREYTRRNGPQLGSADGQPERSGTKRGRGTIKVET